MWGNSEFSLGQYFGRFYLKRDFRILPTFLVFFPIAVALYFGFPRKQSLPTGGEAKMPEMCFETVCRETWINLLCRWRQ
ncbi:MAG: hypothetical protein DME66_00570 [Verrucomicrobia bacterium]|nr:MAG: hypothetical protein DME66_00570 [Verrucomicrobiota bacterium]